MRVRRPSDAWRDRYRSYRVLIDGSGVGRLRRGEQLEVTVSPGPHRVRIRIDWSGSKEVVVDVAEGQVVSFVAAPPRRSIGPLDLLGGSSWVELRPE